MLREFFKLEITGKMTETDGRRETVRGSMINP